MLPVWAGIISSRVGSSFPHFMGSTLGALVWSLKAVPSWPHSQLAPTAFPGTGATKAWAHSPARHHFLLVVKVNTAPHSSQDQEKGTFPCPGGRGVQDFETITWATPRFWDPCTCRKLYATWLRCLLTRHGLSLRCVYLWDLIPSFLTPGHLSHGEWGLITYQEGPDSHRARSHVLKLKKLFSPPGVGIGGDIYL